MAASWSKWSVLQTVYRRYGLKLYRVKLTSRAYSPWYSLSAVSKNSIFCHGHRKTSQSTPSSVPKKDCSKPMEKTYNSAEVEAGWYDWWVQQGFFTPSRNPFCEDSVPKVFSMLLPPPNVTGNLHLGHALTGALQDAIVRWRRMKGDVTLWIPGTDHAGIATHAVVEKKLMREQGKTRHDLGREGFVAEVWRWKKQHGQTITQQLRMLGLSLDWSKEYFTMDERLNVAVTEAFCRLFDKGLIYRDKRMINWSCALRSSLSDIEVDKLTLEAPRSLKVPGLDKKVEFGVLSHFAYPVINSDERIVVATTRLETMLADTAVAVNPDDPRYSHLVGQKVQHPLDRGRLLPIIADSFVDMNFGTGAVKVSPGHDYTDFEVGCRHGLPVIEILTDDGTIRSDVEMFGGENRFEVRRKLREALRLLGYYYGEKEHPTVLPLCSRTGDIVEPRLKEQWFLRCTEMMQETIQVVESGQLKITPSYNEKVWMEWLKNEKDWCLSRQLWWGHRIPVYTCVKSNKTVCARSRSEAVEKLAKDFGVNSAELVQDEDVLDTWFSSSLLPFSIFDWPGAGSDSRQNPASASVPSQSLYFPQTLMETGQDILFFWVARMVMMSLELTGKLPFKEVLLHGMLRDAQGRKMSKSLGNVIDPVDVIKGVSLQELNSRLERGNLDPSEVQVAREGQRRSFPSGIACCGSDALRLTLCSYNLQNVDISFNVAHAESRMRFCNKIWQSFKFIFSKLEPGITTWESFELSGAEDATDLWILSRLSDLVKSCDTNFQSHDVHLVAGSLQHFWHHELCDVYLEAIKPVFINQDESRQEAVKQVLSLCAHTFLLSAAPFMPFLCEELYQRLQQICTRRGSPWPSSICVASYPEPEEFCWHNPKVEENMEQVLSIVHQVLKMRRDYNVLGNKAEIYLQTENAQIKEAISGHMTCLLALSRSVCATVLGPDTYQPSGCSSVEVNPDIKVFLQLNEGCVDIEKEKMRINQKLSKLESYKEQLSVKLDKLESKGLGDVDKAIKIKEKLTSVNDELHKLSEMMMTMSSSGDR